MALVRSGRSGRTATPSKKRQKMAPAKQNIVLFLLSSAMTVPPYCDDLVFLEISLFCNTKKWPTIFFAPGPSFCKAITD